MPSPREIAFSEALRDAFRIQFSVSLEERASGYFLEARPAVDAQDLFKLEATLPSKTRLMLKVIPGSFSRPFIDTLASAEVPRRLCCCEALGKLNDAAHTFIFKVNSLNMLELSPADWPASWDSFEYELTIFPLREHGCLDELLDECMNWCVEALKPLFELIEVVFDSTGFEEGSCQRVLANRYERNPNNRKLCIEARGTKCQICGFDFEEHYGQLGNGFIHIHHIVPVSQIGPNYTIDPANDLIPVCANCHAMLHRVSPPLAPDDLKKLIETQRKLNRS